MLMNFDEEMKLLEKLLRESMFKEDIAFNPEKCSGIPGKEEMSKASKETE